MTFSVAGFVAAGKIDRFTSESLFVEESLDSFEFNLNPGLAVVFSAEITVELATSTTSARETAKRSTQHIATIRRQDNDKKVIDNALDYDALDWIGIRYGLLSFIYIDWLESKWFEMRYVLFVFILRIFCFSFFREKASLLSAADEKFDVPYDRSILV